MDVVCSAFDVARSCYYVHRLRRRRVDARRVALRSQANQLFSQSRGSAGSRSILGMLREEGVTIDRFRVRRLMRELGLVSKQSGSHAYKQATVERPDIPNRLNREFATEHPNQVWCGDITYVWAQGRWHYLAAVLDLHARRVIGWAFSAKPNCSVNSPLSEEEVTWVKSRCNAASRLNLAVLLKTFQVLRYFPEVAEVPEPVVDFIRTQIGLRSKVALSPYKWMQLYRHMSAVRSGLGFSRFTAQMARTLRLRMHS